MGVIAPINETVLSHTGLHLYHTARSNCAARVRLLLEEKKLDWVGHHIDLGKKENITEEYFGINPKGVVPTLVYDGEVVVESNDILLYLEEKFPEPSFREASEKYQAQIKYWLQQSGDLHLPAIKTYQYHKINAKLLPKTEEEEARYAKLQKDPDMLAFHAKHSGGKNFSEEDVNRAISLLNSVFSKIDEAIADGGYIVGDRYTLADISWSPTITTMIAGGYDLGPYTHITDWYEKISRRPQFQEAVIEWRKKATYAAGVDPTIPGPAAVA